MKESSGENQEPEIEESKQEMQSELPEVLDMDLDLKLVEEIEKESEESLDELEKENTDRKSKWETVKGEVEIEGKKVEITYREKVIELPKHRQEQTGITRIRRRELLPPIPKGLYLSSEERKKQLINKQIKDPIQQIETLKLLEEHEPLPVYLFDKSIDDVYKFLTNKKFPANNILIHIMDYRVASPSMRIYPSNLKNKKENEKNIESFKRERLYFQEIYSEESGKHHAEYGDFWLSYARPFVDYYATPVFVFTSENKKLNEYFEFIGRNPDNMYNGRFDYQGDNIPINKDHNHKPLRWCNADLALVPTKRGLNVLFFETGDEDKKENDKE